MEDKVEPVKLSGKIRRRTVLAAMAGGLGEAVLGKANKKIAEQGEEARTEDILTEQELKALNINIHSTAEGVSLRIRRSALKLDPLLATLVEKNSRFKPADPQYPPFKLEIVLVGDDYLKESSAVPEQIKWIYQSMIANYKDLRTHPDQESDEEQHSEEAAGLFQNAGYRGVMPAHDLLDQQTGQEIKGWEAKHDVVFIFLAVGEGLRPKISESYPRPWHLNQSYPSVKEYKYLELNRTAGLNLRHEFFHFEKGSELETDRKAYKSLVEAYDKWIKTGNSQGYYFIFETPEGPVYTKKETTSLAT